MPSRFSTRPAMKSARSSETGRLLVERRHGGHDAGARLRGGEQVAQVDDVQRRFPGYQHEGPGLLERDVGGPFDQGGRGAVGDGGQRLHGARNDDHPVGAHRPARDRRRQVPDLVFRERALPHLVAVEAGQSVLQVAARSQAGFLPEYVPAESGQHDADPVAARPAARAGAGARTARRWRR